MKLRDIRRNICSLWLTNWMGKRGKGEVRKGREEGRKEKRKGKEEGRKEKRKEGNEGWIGRKGGGWLSCLH